MTDAPARLLRGTPGTPLTLAQHEAMFPAPETPMSLPDQLDASGLTGRGGGAVLTANKARLLAGQKHRAAAVVVNAMEGEPASRKDATLLSTNPHLVLDGAEALGSIIRTNEVIICVARGQRAVIDRVQRAVNERRGERLRRQLHHPDSAGPLRRWRRVGPHPLAQRARIAPPLSFTPSQRP